VHGGLSDALPDASGVYDALDDRRLRRAGSDQNPTKSLADESRSHPRVLTRHRPGRDGRQLDTGVTVITEAGAMTGSGRGLRTAFAPDQREVGHPRFLGQFPTDGPQTAHPAAGQRLPILDRRQVIRLVRRRSPEKEAAFHGDEQVP